MKQMLLNPADVAEEGKVEELYKRLAEQSQRAMEILKDSGQAGSEVMKSAKNINDNVNIKGDNSSNTFMNSQLKLSSTQKSNLTNNIRNTNNFTTYESFMGITKGNKFSQ